MRKLLAVDLFAGCGGLTLGIRQAGFAVKCAVENDRDAALTYKRNHRATTALVQDIAKVTGEDIDKALQGEPLSLLVGCAPCQGFTSLTRKWRRPDPRNQLLMEMARLYSGNTTKRGYDGERRWRHNCRCRNLSGVFGVPLRAWVLRASQDRANGRLWCSSESAPFSAFGWARVCNPFPSTDAFAPSRRRFRLTTMDHRS